MFTKPEQAIDIHTSIHLPKQIPQSFSFGITATQPMFLLGTMEIKYQLKQLSSHPKISRVLEA